MPRKKPRLATRVKQTNYDRLIEKYIRGEATMEQLVAQEPEVRARAWRRYFAQHNALRRVLRAR